MLAAEFDALVARLDDMSLPQIQRLAREATSRAKQREALAEIERSSVERASCVYCTSTRLVRWGTGQTGLQRWRCKDCSRTFNSAHGTRLSGARFPDRLLTFVENMLSPSPWSCREAAAELGVHPMTAWRWRMKVCAVVAGLDTAQLAGVVEADETFQRESRKGSREWIRHEDDPTTAPEPPRMRWYEYKRKDLPMKRGLSRWQIPILTLADRSGSRRADVLQGLSWKQMGPRLEKHVAVDSVLCSDKASAYKKFAKNMKVKHIRVAARRGERVHTEKKNGKAELVQSYHIQTVNALHGRFKNFIREFDGPSTKNLKAYVDWFVFRDQRGLGKEQALKAFRLLVAP